MRWTRGLPAKLIGLALAIVLAVHFSTPAKASLGDCFNLAVKGTEAEAIIAAKAITVAGCTSTVAGGDIIMGATIGVLTALAIAGKFEGADACHQMIDTAIGALIAKMLIESGLAGLLDKITPGASSLLADIAGGTATQSITDAIPVLAGYIDCGCTVAGAPGDIKATVEGLIATGEGCKDFAADAVGAFADGLESGANAVGEFFEDAYCSIFGCDVPPEVVDCQSGKLFVPEGTTLEKVGDTGYLVKYGDGANISGQTCSCPAPLEMVYLGQNTNGAGSDYKCVCPYAGQSFVEANVCACSGNQQLLKLDGHEPFCSVCPAGASKDGQTCQCGQGETIVQAGINGAAACGVCPANGARQWFGEPVCVLCEPGQIAHDNWEDIKGACSSCGSRAHPDATQHNCVSCQANEYLNPGTQSCNTCDASKGQYLNAGGTACFSANSCGPGEAPRPVKFSDAGSADFSLQGFVCDCKEGTTKQNGVCVTDLQCNSAQDPDYVNMVCKNVIDCGSNEIITLGGGEFKKTDAHCTPCTGETVANSTTNTCDSCPTGASYYSVAGLASCTCPENQGNVDGACSVCPPDTLLSGWGFGLGGKCLPCVNVNTQDEAQAAIAAGNLLCSAPPSKRPFKTCSGNSVPDPKDPYNKCMSCGDLTRVENVCLLTKPPNMKPSGAGLVVPNYIPSLNCPAYLVLNEDRTRCVTPKVGIPALTKSGPPQFTIPKTLPKKTGRPEKKCAVGTPRADGSCPVLKKQDEPKRQATTPRPTPINCPPGRVLNKAGTGCVLGLDDEPQPNIPATKGPHPGSPPVLNSPVTAPVTAPVPAPPYRGR